MIYIEGEPLRTAKIKDVVAWCHRMSEVDTGMGEVDYEWTFQQIHDRISKFLAEHGTLDEKAIIMCPRCFGSGSVWGEL